MTFSENPPFKRLIPKGKIVIGNNVFLNTHTDVVQAFEGTTIIEDGVIVGQGVIVGHDSHVHKDVRINNSVILNGHVTIGENTTINSGANIRNRITIGKNTIIGMGSVVVKDIPDNVIAYGNPCEIRGNNTLSTLIMRKITKEVKRIF